MKWDDALCRDYPHDWWFPSKGDDVTRARAICGRCPIRQECFDHAVAERIGYGIWGGVSMEIYWQSRRPLNDTAMAVLGALENVDTVRDIAEVTGQTTDGVQQRLVRLRMAGFVASEKRDEVGRRTYWRLTEMGQLKVRDK